MSAFTSWMVVVLGLWLSVPASGLANPAGDAGIVLTDTDSSLAISSHLETWADSSKAVRIEDLASLSTPGAFIATDKAVPSFGFSPAAHWARLRIRNDSATSDNWLLVLDYAPIQIADIYLLHDSKVVFHQSGGSSTPLSQRPYPFPVHVFNLPVPAGESRDLYLRIDGESSKTFPLSIVRADHFAMDASRKMGALALCFGVLIGLLIYNTFILVTVREAAYAWYVLFLAATIFAISSIQGLAQAVFWPDSTQWALTAIPFFMGLFHLFSVLFTMSFLHSRSTSPRLHKILSGLAVFSCIEVVLALVASYRIGIMTVVGFSVIWSITLFIMGAIAARSGNVAARYFLLAWLFLLLGVGMNSLRAANVFPTNGFTENTYMIGSALEALLLSVALAARLRSMKEEIAGAQKQVIEQKQLALDTITHYNQKLSEEVTHRTRELVDTQKKLVASEKAAALGVFTAGMAHEINNPANFVSVGAQNARAQISELQQHLLGLVDDTADSDLLEGFGQRFTRIQSSLDTIHEGILRIGNVVNQLRSNHPEGVREMRSTDLVTLLENTARIVTGETKIPVQLDIRATARPWIACQPQSLEQMFQALLRNALHAIEEARDRADAGYQGRIAINATHNDGKLVIDIVDNGAGIPAHLQDKIFDAFFTTKGVGRGAGLGLSMARDVITEHEGDLSLVESSNVGTRFRLIVSSHT